MSSLASDCEFIVRNFTPRLRIAILGFVFTVLSIQPCALASQPVDNPQLGGRSPTSQPPAHREVGRLMAAILVENEQAVRDALRSGANANKAFAGSADAPLTPLFLMIARDNEQLARVLLTEAPQLDLTHTYWGYTPLDLANVRGQTALAARIAAELRQRQHRRQASPTAAHIAWVANGIARLSEAHDSGTALGLLYITAAFDEGHFSQVPEEVVSTAKRLRDSCDAARERRAAPLTTHDLQAIVSQSVRNRRVALRILPQLDHIGGLQSGTSSSAAFKVAYLQAQDSTQGTSFYRDALTAAHVLAQTSATAAQIIDRFAAQQLNAKVEMQHGDIVAANPASFHSSIVQLIGRSTDLAAVGQSWAALAEAIRGKTRDAAAQIRNSGNIPQTASPATSFAVYESAVYVLSSVAFAQSPKMASDLFVAGNAMIHIGKSIDAFVKAGAATLLSCTTMVGGIAEGLMSLTSLFVGGQDVNALILDQIQSLHQELADMRTELNQRLNRIDRRLDDIYDTLLHGFQSLASDVAAVQQQLGHLSWQLSFISSQLNTLEGDTRAYLLTVFDSPISREVNRVLDWSATHNDPLPVEVFQHALDSVLEASTRETMLPLISGRRPSRADINDDRTLAQAYMAMKSQGIDSNLGLLQAVAIRFLPESRFGQRQLANPERWSTMAETYYNIAIQNPDLFAKSFTPAGIDRIVEFGRSWRGAIGDLNARNGADRELFGRLLDFYQQKADGVRAQLKSAIEQYESASADSYDLWDGPDQQPRGGRRLSSFGVPSLEPSVDFDHYGEHGEGPQEVKCWQHEHTLDAPPELRDWDAAQRILARPLLIAHHLQLGRIRAKWTAPHWAHIQHKQVKPEEDRIIGQAACSVVLTFVAPDGSEREILRREVESQRDFNYGIIVWKMRVVSTDVPIPEPPGNRRPRRGPAPRPRYRHEMHLERTGQVAWQSGNWQDGRSYDPCRERNLFQEQLKGNWDEMRRRVFSGSSPADNKGDAVSTARALVSQVFAERQTNLDDQLRSKAAGGDGEMKAAFDQLSAAKGLLRGFVLVGLPSLVAEDVQLRQLVDGTTAQQGQVLIDSDMLPLLAANGVPLAALTRVNGWLDEPVQRFRQKLTSAAIGEQKQPIIEKTLEELAALEEVYRLARPAKPIEDAVSDLRQSAASFIASQGSGQ
jgi:hypothetical protein